MEPKRIIILFSGGADSVLMLLWALKMKLKVLCVIFDYGQIHSEEMETAMRFLRKTKTKLLRAITKGAKEEGDEDAVVDDFVAPLSWMTINLCTSFEHTHSTLLGNSEATYENVHPAHVPGRNLIFTSVAFSIAESIGYDEVWIGCDNSDYDNRFPDCMPEWIKKTNEVGHINGSRPIALRAPLLGLSKEDVVQMLEAEGVTKDDYYSGYGNYLR